VIKYLSYIKWSTIIICFLMLFLGIAELLYGEKWYYGIYFLGCTVAFFAIDIAHGTYEEKVQKDIERLMDRIEKSDFKG